jgi:tetratricopeptide (TPR) repeat protein
MTAELQRALVLFQQSRPDLAEPELRRSLASDPDNPTAHGLLALCLAQIKRLDDASKEAEQAVQLAPDLPFAHYAVAQVLHLRDRLDEARAAIQEAIRLDAWEPDYFGLLGAVEFAARRWQAALRAAERGLAIDPEHIRCANLRSMALVMLGRREEARQSIDSALAKDPGNALTHANQGWALLHASDHQGALEHFREALRLDPELDWARAGLVEALKARHHLYGLMLRYFLWMSRLGTRARWGVLLGGYLAYQVLREVARGMPQLAPLITPLLLLYAGFAVLSWTADPLFNALLRFHPLGRYALTDEQVLSATWVGGMLAAALLAALGFAATRQHGLLLAAGVLGVLILPLAAVFQCPEGWPRTTMKAYTALLAVLGVASVSAAFSARIGTANSLFGLTLAGAFIGTWIGTFLVTARPKH